MPRRFLNRIDRQRFSHFPSEVTEADCIVYFTLTPADKEFVKSRRGGANRLGVALLLGGLRYLGYFPPDVKACPKNVIDFVANQIEVSPTELQVYAQRDETRWDHLSQVMSHLNFRRVQMADRQDLVKWLGERALEHERPSLLLQQASERLYKQRLVRPAITTMEEIVADARQWAEDKTVEVLVNPLPLPTRRSLDRLLEIDQDLGKTPLTWLRRYANGHSDRDILEALQKLKYIRQWAAARWDVDQLPPSRLTHLAQIARHNSNQGLKRKKPPATRYAILVAFLIWAHEKTIDELIELFDLCLADAYRRAKRELKEFQLSYMARMQQVVGYFREMSHVVLDEEVAADEIRPSIYQQVPITDLKTALDDVESFFESGRQRTHLDFFDNRYSYFRRFTPAFLRALTFHNYADKESLLEALDILREMNEQADKLPTTFENVPTDFVPSPWRKRVINYDGSVTRRDYEMCTLSVLRDSLRSGGIWLEGSRQYASLDSYLIPKDRWEELRPIFCDMVGTLDDGLAQLALKQRTLEANLKRLDEEWANNEFVRFENGEFVLSPLEKEEEEIRQEHPLSKKVGALLPKIQLGQLLAEVDEWTNFSQHLTHAGEAASRIPDLSTHLYAAILTQSCNMTLRSMADLSDLTYDQLYWCTNWYIREETLKTATDVVVNYHFQQNFSKHWGSGSFSSSDGQRFPVARDTNMASPLPRYFGFGRGISIITWTSDQLSQYGVRVTPPRIRESTFTLDAILDNHTDLDIQEHATDTGGYTDMLFALFDLLGLRFSPRLRDIGDYTIYHVDPSLKYKHIGPLLSAKPLKTTSFTGDWDELLRIAASMKMGWVTASTFISKLLAYPRQHKFTQTLIEYGRLIRSTHIPFYLADHTSRRRILVQLNKGEEVNGLHEYTFFDNKGQIRKQQPDDLVNLASCLNLVSNAVIVWNTVYMEAAVKKLREEGHTISDDDLVHLSPVRFEHINRYGKFRFDRGEDLGPSGLRNLRIS
ncbi:MAG: Tn3 family transposase [Chloroflexota bacterium]